MATTPTALAKPQNGQPCPCGTDKLFEACCGPLLAGTRAAASAEELMRSRFTAHVAHDERYLHFSYQPTARLPYIAGAEDLQPVAWTRLAVHSHEPGRTPDLAFVDFSAFYLIEGGGEAALQEKSEFQRVDGKWLFSRSVRQGPAPLKSTAPKVGRNDPCPCGSGKKYKQCCLAKA